MNLTADQVLDEIADQRERLRAFGVRRLGLFGSVVRGEAGTQSDLDFLVELERHTFDDYFGLLAFLEDLFGCKIDLVEAEAVKPRLKPYIDAEIRYAEEL